jgi:hypothetical protein
VDVDLSVQLLLSRVSDIKQVGPGRVADDKDVDVAWRRAGLSDASACPGGAFVLHNTAADGSGTLDQYLVSTLNISGGKDDPPPGQVDRDRQGDQPPRALCRPRAVTEGVFAAAALALSVGLLSATRVAVVVFAVGCVLLLPFVSKAFGAQPATRTLSTRGR